MQKKCFSYNCENQPTLECLCTTPPTAFCDMHKSMHQLSNQNHKLREYYPILSAAQNIYIAVPGSELNPVYTIGAFSNTVCLLQLSTKSCKPKTSYISCIESLNSRFIKKVLNLEKAQDSKLINQISKYLHALSKLYLNKKINYKNFCEQIKSIYDRYISDIDTEFMDEILKTTSQLKTFCKMPKTVMSFFRNEITIEHADNNFYEKFLIMKDMTKENLISLFKDQYSKFIKDDSHIEKEFSNLYLKFSHIKDKIKPKYHVQLSEYLNSLDENCEFMCLDILYSKLDVNLENVDAEFNLFWEVILQRIVLKTEIKIVQTLEISGFLFIVLADIQKNMGFVVIYDETRSYVSLIVDDSNIFLASGSRKDNIILTQKLPKICYFYYLDEQLKMQNFHEIPISLDTCSEVTSLAYIEERHSLLFTTEEGDCVGYDIDKERLVSPFIGDINTKAIQVFYMSRMKIIILQTQEIIYFYNNDYCKINQAFFQSSYLYFLKHKKYLYIYYNENNKISNRQVIFNDEDLDIIFKTSPKKNIQIIQSLMYIKTRGKMAVKEYEAKLNKYECIIKEHDFDKTDIKSIETPITKIVKDGYLFSLNGSYKEQTHNNEINPHEISDENTNLECKYQCELCINKCAIINLHSLHLCGNDHKCRMICVKPGNCSDNQKQECWKSIPKGSFEHEGQHECIDHEASCQAICPNCNVCCYYQPNHEGLHKNSKHLKTYFGLNCEESCRIDEHTHQIVCPGEGYCMAVNCPDYVEHREGYDFWNNCHKFWDYVGWDISD
ncbi:hypothetical protein SteCoe_33557 [Stentor coeruleus]|uniref:Uncharacterized protein n=1 Tax=Stentor coeruleus TaxID=5963 RepID=A0A1R2AWP1_9CILI|nr:hypothetical protein SteCoe_33557 [Stentor coeruleus]